MGVFEIYGIGCGIVFAIILMYALNEWLHGRDMTTNCAISCVFLIAMSWASGLVVLWVLAMNTLEHFKWDDIIAIKGRQKSKHYGRQD